MVTKAEEERRRRAEEARAIGLWRYEIVQDLIDPALTAKQRGALARSVAERVHIGLSGEPVRVSRKTIDRWLRWYRIGGFDALVPSPKQAPPRPRRRYWRWPKHSSGRIPRAPPPRCGGFCA